MTAKQTFIQIIYMQKCSLLEMQSIFSKWNNCYIEKEFFQLQKLFCKLTKIFYEVKLIFQSSKFNTQLFKLFFLEQLDAMKKSDNQNLIRKLVWFQLVYFDRPGEYLLIHQEMVTIHSTFSKLTGLVSLGWSQESNNEWNRTKSLQNQFSASHSSVCSQSQLSL